jgi:hypothetical protein
MLERDLILRLIQDLARLVARVMGLKKRGEVAEAAAEVETAARSLLGLDWRIVLALDPSLLASQLAQPGKTTALASLCWLRAGLEADLPVGAEHGPAEAGARSGDADVLRRKAVELWLEAGAAGAELDDDALRAILAQPGGTLGPRHETLRRALVGPG